MASVDELRADLKETEAKWLSAEAAVHRAKLVLEAAKDKFERGHEVFDAAIVCLEQYAQ